MLNVAVIGVGSMGKNHARIYSSLRNVNLVAVADLNKEAVEKIAAQFSCKGYTNYKEMLESEEINAISVAVPTINHKEVAMEVLSSGINLLIEKPIADTVENAKEIIELADSKNLKLGVGHVERFNPVITKLKELIDNGKLGKITSIIAKRVGLFPPRIKDANVILDIAVHDIDICNYLLSSLPKEIFARGGKALNNNQEDYAEIFLNYGNVNSLIQVNWITPVKIRVIEVTGTKGYARANYITQQLTLYKSNYDKVPDNFGDFVIKFGEPSREDVLLDTQEPLKLEINDFLNSIGSKRDPLIKGREALDTLKIAITASKMCSNSKNV